MQHTTLTLQDTLSIDINSPRTDTDHYRTCCTDDIKNYVYQRATLDINSVWRYPVTESSTISMWWMPMWDDSDRTELLSWNVFLYYHWNQNNEFGFERIMYPMPQGATQFTVKGIYSEDGSRLVYLNYDLLLADGTHQYQFSHFDDYRSRRIIDIEGDYTGADIFGNLNLLLAQEEDSNSYQF